MRREREGRLLKVANPTLDRLYLTLQLAGCSVVLCDSDGVILEGRRRDADAADFDSAGLSEGADWSEQSQGTNGIGTCIAEKRLASILKDQHFRASNIGMSCFGAPVLDSRGQLRAVLDISTCRDTIDPALNTLIGQAVFDAAAQIESDFFCEEYSGFRIVQAPREGIRSPALLAVDSFDLIVGATRGARKRFGLPLDADLEPVPAADLLGDGAQRGVGFDSAERRELKRALARSKGNVSAAARALGVSRATLYRRLTRLGLAAGES